RRGLIRRTEAVARVAAETEDDMAAPLDLEEVGGAGQKASDLTVTQATGVRRPGRGSRILPRTRGRLHLVANLVVIVGSAIGFPLEPDPGVAIAASAGIVADDNRRQGVRTG